jgi:phage terminase large subunit-like protein
MGALSAYFGDGILGGRIASCEKMKLVAARIMDWYEHPGEFHFDQQVADRHIGFMEEFCCLPAGKRGMPLRLELFQRARFEVIFGFVDDAGLRKIQEVLTLEGRKNAKTTETSAVCLDLTANDDEFGPETYFVATKLEQSHKGFDSALKMVRQSPELAAVFHKRVSDLFFPPTMGIIKPLASNTNTLDSLDVHAGFIDELAAIKNRDLYDLIKQGMGARLQPLLWEISTNGFIRDGIFDAQYEYATKWLNGEIENDRFVCFIYELDDRSEWTDESCWIKANPGLGPIKKLSILRDNVAKAKVDPSFKPTVMVKDFNMIENVATAWLTYQDILCVEPDPNSEGKTRPVRFDFASMGFRYGVGGMDAADSVDLCAARVLCMRRYPEGHPQAGEIDPRIYTKSMYWLPETVLEEWANSGNRRERDSVPYSLWEQQGKLRAAPGNRVDKHVFLDWFRELRDDSDLYIRSIGYDPYHIDPSLLAEFQAEFGKNSMVLVRQGVKTMSGPLKDLKADMQANLIADNGNPIDMWCASNASVKVDINNEIQLVKEGDPRKRIDGLVALACGYIALQAGRDDYLNSI